MTIAGDAEEGTIVQIWVAATDPGNPYRPDRSAADPDGTRDRRATFRLAPNVELYGGFLGLDHPTLPQGEDNLAQSNPELNETVLTGTQPASAPPPDCGDPNAGSCFESNGTPGCDDPYCCEVVCSQNPFCCAVAWDQNCADQAADTCPGDAYHVVSGIEPDDTVRLDGFTITGGVADGPGADDGRGGGVFLKSGGLSPTEQRPLIARCKVTGNYAVDGGGMYMEDDPGGQGIFPQVLDSRFIANEAAHDGGAVHIGVKAGGTFVNCLLVSNEAWNDGGALYMLGNKLQELVNCTISGNTADSEMDGVGDGGGVFVDQTDPTVVLVENGILWANEDSGPTDETAQLFVLAGAGGSVTVSYSDIDGTALPPGTADGGGNIFVDPLFVSPAAGDYRLGQLCSRCIDRADNGAAPPDDHDVDHDTNTAEKTPDLDILDRMIDGVQDGTPVVDMGAYEFIPLPLPWDCESTPDGFVGIVDFLDLLMQWGQECTSCDFGLGDPGVGIQEFLAVLAHWTTPLTIEDVVEEAGLVYPDDWDAFVDAMTDPNVSEAEKDNWRCWMDHYLDCHRQPFCFECACQICPDADPYGNH